MGSVLHTLPFLHLIQTRIPESERGCVIPSPRTRRGQPWARTHPSRGHVSKPHPMGPRVHSYSQCLHLHLFVAKKDGGLRPCIDYRALNKITVKFRYPLPLVPAALEQLRGARIFTKLDLHSAYNLIRIREGEEWKTAFVTPTGHYEYRVMPYGIANAPSVFQDFMHEVLREFLHQFVLVYIDDILIYSRGEAEHRQHVAEVLQRLRKNNLFLKAEKFSFHQSSVKFLGYLIDQEGIKMDEGKVTTIQDWPMPTSIKEIQRFLGFTIYKPKSLSWTPSAMKSFNILKETFITAPILVHPDPSKAFVVEVDASTTGVGAVLSQQQGNPAKLHPCAFFSCKLSPAEKNYDIGNRELLAIKLALEEWRHWLEGTQEPFIVLTDHKNLEYLREAKRLNPRQARWACSSHASISPSHTDQDPGIWKRMRYPVSTHPKRTTMSPNPSFQRTCF